MAVTRLMRPFACAALALTLTAASQPAHDKTFWKAIAAGGYHPPAGSSVTGLAAELSDLLQSSDPELRDEIAYTTLAVWIYQQRLIEPDDLRPLIDRWIGNLRNHVGASGGDEIYGRSFSALVLSVVDARDNAVPFLTRAEFTRLLDAALEYLHAEQDVRGYEPEHGWMHSTAHTGDLVKFLARSRYLTAADQQRVLAAIADKLRQSPVFVFGEDERLARAALSVVKRPDFDLDGFRTWVGQATPVQPRVALPPLAVLRGNQNLKNFLAKLEVVLSLDDAKSAAQQTALDLVRAALKQAY